MSEHSYCGCGGRLYLKRPPMARSGQAWYYCYRCKTYYYGETLQEAMRVEVGTNAFWAP